MERNRPVAQSPTEIPSGTTDQQNARFQVVGQTRKKNEFQTTQLHGRGNGNIDQQKSKSLFSNFLEMKRQEVTSQQIPEETAHEEITDSMKEFASDREKRFVVLKLRK
jgi:hypothetical protein